MPERRCHGHVREPAAARTLRPPAGTGSGLVTAPGPLGHADQRAEPRGRHARLDADHLEVREGPSRPSADVFHTRSSTAAHPGPGSDRRPRPRVAAHGSRAAPSPRSTRPYRPPGTPPLPEADRLLGHLRPPRRSATRQLTGQDRHHDPGLLLGRHRRRSRHDDQTPQWSDRKKRALPESLTRDMPTCAVELVRLGVPATRRFGPRRRLLGSEPPGPDRFQRRRATLSCRFGQVVLAVLILIEEHERKPRRCAARCRYFVPLGLGTAIPAGAPIPTLAACWPPQAGLRARGVTDRVAPLAPNLGRGDSVDHVPGLKLVNTGRPWHTC